MKPVYRAAAVRDIDAAIARLLDYPEIGMASGLRRGVRSIPAREHRIYYRIDGSKLVIARVLHKAMETGRYL